MSNYKIFETNNFIKKMGRIDKRQQEFISLVLKEKTYPQLSMEPHFGNNIKKLKGYTPNTWRYRIGNYRVFYEIEEDVRIVDIIGIDTRESAY